MSKRAASRYVCQSCGEVFPKWQGQCASCGAWNSLVEEAAPVVTPFAAKHQVRGGARLQLSDLRSGGPPAPRASVGMAELDRTLGGGLVPGSAILLGGDPGIGKSTLLLQAAALLARAGQSVVYISGEEADAQVRLRAERLGLSDAPVALGTATSLKDILATLEAGPPPALVIIDSIQTVYADQMESAPGTVGQVRLCAQELIRYAKRSGAALVLVGHVTKDGQIAGPRVLEHMVDTVLYFEGERGAPFRILRSVKNRFGGTDEIGVFAMADKGLVEVANPSELFLSTRQAPVSGSVVFAGIEGTRPVLVEIQALVARLPSGATPRRAVVGWDSGRLAMVLAVLEARCGLPLGGYEVYLNVAGGLRISEPAADLAVAVALVSALTDVALPLDTVVFGEIALSGDVRPVAQMASRLKEAAKLGFVRAIVPAQGETGSADLTTARFRSLAGVVNSLTESGGRA
jgi:DNA repair protein RadA/Sms